MSKELKALERIKNFMSVNAHHWKQDVSIIETALKALEIIKKYYSIKEDLDDFIPYQLIDKQYVSNRSCIVMSKEERDKDFNDINDFIKKQVEICSNCEFVKVCINTPINPKPFICRKEEENGN